MSMFIGAEELKERQRGGNVALVDCRFDLFDPEYGKRSYGENHIEGAFFMDVNRDICGEKRAHGGARPVPDEGDFIGKLEGMGISDSTEVVLYDDDIYGAARAFWQMKYIGMDNVKILEGGWRGWTEAGGACSNALPDEPARGKLSLKIDESIYCGIEYVAKRIGDKGVAIIDGRARERFTGEYEPLYAKAGHIPGAMSFPCSENMEGDCLLKDRAALGDIFSPLQGYDEIISYCGSGIAGARNFVALREIGLPVRLYVGSLSDWISYDENPVETGE